jgi:hypothetical protein
MGELNFARRAVEDAQKALDQVQPSTKEIQILVRAREESAKSFAEAIRNSPGMAQAAEQVRAILAANEVQIQKLFRQAIQPYLESIQATIREATKNLPEIYVVPAIPRFAFDLPPAIPPSYLANWPPVAQPSLGPITPLEDDEMEDAAMLTGTATLEEGTFEDEDGIELAVAEMALQILELEGRVEAAEARTRQAIEMAQLYRAELIRATTYALWDETQSWKNN